MFFKWYPEESLVCDFCSSPDRVTARYLVDDFKSKAFQSQTFVHVSIGAWAACAVCEKFLDNNDWDGLINNSIQSFFKRHVSLETVITQDDVKQELITLYEQIREHNFRKDKTYGSKRY